MLPNLSIAVLIVAAPCAAQSTFTVVGLPDTQEYAEFYPDIFDSQTSWIVEQRFIRDIRFVSHYGDIVNNGESHAEWLRADLSMGTLDDDDLPYGVCPGNHDITPNGNLYDDYLPEHYIEYFGPDRFEDESWFHGASPSGMSSYQMLSLGGHTFIFLHLDCGTPVAELAWAQAVLDRNRDKPVFLTTHRYLQDSEEYVGDWPINTSGRYPGIWYIVEPPWTPTGIESNEFFRWFVRRNPSIFMVNCGHFSAEFNQTSSNVEGLPVHEVLADFQSNAMGGGGYLRILEFDTAANTIDVSTYSPYLDDSYTDDDSQFTLAVDFDAHETNGGFAIFHDGFNGYTGTRDTWISEHNPDQAYGNDSTRWADDDVAESPFGDDEGHVMIRFENLLGSSSNGKIPSGATVLRAVLNLEIEADIDGVFNPDFYVWELLVPWEENSTWNSMDGGLSEDQDLGEYLGAFLGDNEPDDDTLRRIDITPAVQRWVNGAANYGIAILPEIIWGNDEGIAIWTREASNPLMHPTLEVWYEAEDASNPADINGDGDVNGADLALVLAGWSNTSGSADINLDGIVNGADLALVLAAWTG